MEVENVVFKGGITIVHKDADILVIGEGDEDSNVDFDFCTVTIPVREVTKHEQLETTKEYDLGQAVIDIDISEADQAKALRIAMQALEAFGYDRVDS